MGEICIECLNISIHFNIPLFILLTIVNTIFLGMLDNVYDKFHINTNSIKNIRIRNHSLACKFSTMIMVLFVSVSITSWV